ncbi:WD40 repeat domain-containing protein [Lunatimonas salinarum]|uniref:WD40 repeat domain-containing protein n=1 Tax=Lunatimonas salinarum TaxID=1774590 RepID=UPI001AE04B77|nr:WD40 repeat domain-containing protein [Lunatimonas salinarum]
MSKITVNKLHTLAGHNHSIFALAEGVNPRFFYTGAGDGYVVEWDMDHPKDGKLIAKLPHSVYALAVDPVRNLLVIGHNFEGIHVIDLTDRKEIWSLKLTSQPIFDLAIAGDTLHVATGDGVLIVVDMEERSPRKHIKLSDAALRSLALHPRGGQLAIGSSDHSVKIIETNSYSPVAKLDKHSNSVFALGYSPDGNILISGGRDAHLHIWDAANFNLEKSIVAHMFAINYLSFRDDGRYFVTCSMDKSIKLWDAHQYQLLKVIDKGRHAGHGTSINKVFWSRHNGQVVAVSDDRTVSIWNIEV